MRYFFKILLNSDNAEIREKSAELCADWCENIEGRLLWFASKKAIGKCHLVRLREDESKKRAVETLLQLSATKPISLEFLKIGLGEILQQLSKCC